MQTLKKVKKIVRILSIFIGAFCISQAVGWISVSATVADCNAITHEVPCMKVNTQYIMDTVVGSPTDNVVFFDSNYFYYNGIDYVTCGSLSTACDSYANYHGDVFIYSSGSWSLYNGNGNFSGSNVSSSSSGFYWLGVGTILTIGITTTTPEPDATNVNAYTHFTGTYDNDGTYDTIGIEYQRIEDNANVLHFKICDIAGTGTGLTYSCYASLSTNSHYMYQPYLWDSNQDFPQGVVLDSESPYYFTTGLVYEVQAPSAFSACDVLDIGCYIRDVTSFIGDYFTNFYTFLQSLFIPNMDNIISSYQDSFSEYSSRIPFSYVFGLRDIITSLSSSTVSGLSVSVPFGSQNIVLLSSSSLSSNPISPIVKTSLSVVIWLLFAYLVYKRGVSLFS